jgi:hypothetical protein
MISDNRRAFGLGADHLIFEGGGGLEDSDCAIIFPPRGARQIFFPCKSAAKDIFFPIDISRQDLPLIITAYSNLRLSYSYRQRRSDVAGVFSQRRPRTESQEGPRNFHCALIYFIWLCLNVPHTKACRFTYKKCITAPKPKTCRDRVEYSKMGEVQYMNDL